MRAGATVTVDRGPSAATVAAAAGPERALHAALVAAGLACGFLLRATNLGGPAFAFDELYDVFAAKSFLAGEGFRLPHGTYERGRLATLLTAAAFALFGESEAAARLHALVFGLLTLVLVYVAGRRLFGPTAGLVALWLAALSPDLIDVARFARLYSPLTFLTLLAALAAFRGLEGEPPEGPRLTRPRLAWLALAAGTTLVAAGLHTVALGLAAVVQAYAGLLALGLLAHGRRREAAPYGLVVAALLAAEVAALASPGLRGRVLDTALTALPWYAPTSGGWLFYHRHLEAQYQWLWAMVWPATAVVVLARPRPGLYVALAFWLPFAALSTVVAAQSPRSLVHALPFAWLLVGGATAALWPAARAAIEARITSRLRRPAARRVAVAVVLVAALAPVVRLTPSVIAAVRRPGETTGTHFTTNYLYDWRGLRDAVGPRLPADSRIVSGVPLAVRYYFGRPAYRLVSPAHRAGETRGRLEEGRVQRADHLAGLRRGDFPVWIFAESWRWERPGQLDAGLRALILASCRAVDVPTVTGLLVFACDPEAPPAGSSQPGS